jgi:hypothetical protein
MFTISKDENLLTFTLEREKSRFGEGTRVLFWVDLHQRALQRGRQEALPIDSIEGFGVSQSGDLNQLICRVGSVDITLHSGDEGQDEFIRAAGILAEFCGADLLSRRAPTG